MKQVKTIMPIYTGDVSGVPSALYELGGMIVMHDASGCNSTYNTHDELRWYDRESLIYISGMTDIDAIMGNDHKLEGEIIEAALEMQPAFIALAGTPIPFINGTDFAALAKSIERQTKIPCFFVETNGTYTYVEGAANAFLSYGDHMIPSIEKAVRSNQIAVNVLGMTPLDFALSGYDQSIKSWLTDHDMRLISNIAMGSAPSEIAKASLAAVNLVVSVTGLKLAKMMYERDHIPYVIGAPVGCFADIVEKAIIQAAESGQPVIAYNNRLSEADAAVRIVGEPVISSSIAAAVSELYHVPVQVLVPFECPQEVLLDADKVCAEEEELIQALCGAETVICDRLLEVLCDQKSRIYRLPHVACSGRIDADKMPDLMKILKEAHDGIE